MTFKNIILITTVLLSFPLSANNHSTENLLDLQKLNLLNNVKIQNEIL